MKKGLLASLLVISTLFTACTTAAPAAPAPTPGATETGNVAKPTDANKMYIGIVASRTGTNKATGEMAYNGALMAVEEINAAGGILGKQIELVVSDEIDNLQASVNASTRLLSDESISAIIGSQYSSNVLAVLPKVLESKYPFVACGSNNLIADAKNPYVWQPRNLDNRNAAILTKFAFEELEVKKPALLYATLPNMMGPGAKVEAAYKADYGIEIPKDRIFAFSVEEKNFAPLISQIQNSGADGLISFGDQQSFALISKAIADAGLDIPRLANATVTSSIVITNAGKAADGWYSTPDWAPYIDTTVGAKFQKNYKAKYNQDTETSSAVTYDAVYMIKAASELAKSTTDREAINKGFMEIKDLEGVLGTFTAFDDHTFLSKVHFTKTVDGKAMLQKMFEFR